MSTFQHIDLQLVSPNFDSALMDALMELNHLRKLQLYGTTMPHVFFQLKDIFHLLESVSSARIEGNQTTISEYVEQKIGHSERSTEQFSEIANVEQAMKYIDESMSPGVDITHRFIRELHHITVDGISDEGDRTPGAYRTWGVEIKKSSHLPPEPHFVQEYMNELVDFINEQQDEKYDLIKTALAHHRFVWIHPFGNGNGRVVRLLTYALLIKYGFRVSEGQLLNPTAVFCNDREKYYETLSIADSGGEESSLVWCEYVLTGICEEISKVHQLLDYSYLSSNILRPTVARSKERKIITKDEEVILRLAIDKQLIKAADIRKALPQLTQRQVTHQISKLKSNNMLMPMKSNGREYSISVNNNYLLRSLIVSLEQEGFIPKFAT